MTIENLVLAGGGAKGIAYIGVARALEERNILKNILRFAGNNTGSIVAALLCVGFNSYDVEALMPVTIKLLYRDSWRIIRTPHSNGWHPSEKFKKYMGDVLALKTKDSSITFAQIYRDYKGKELCITATTEEAKEEKTYDSKTNAATEIREAICKSIYIPAKLQPNKKKFQYGDDGFLCKYPIRCFGGETLGCLTYSNTGDLVKNNWPEDTKLSSKTQRKKNLSEEIVDCLEYKETFFNIFISERKKVFSLEEFEQTFKTESVKPEKNQARLYAEMMYGLDVDARMIYEDVKKMDRSNVDVTEGNLDELQDTQDKLFKDILKVILGKVDESISFNGTQKNNFLNKEDVAKTIDVDTGYICASDFSMKDCDIKFLIKQGKDSTEKFVQKKLGDSQFTSKEPKTQSLTEDEIEGIKRNYTL